MKGIRDYSKFLQFILVKQKVTSRKLKIKKGKSPFSLCILRLLSI